MVLLSTAHQTYINSEHNETNPLPTEIFGVSVLLLLRIVDIFISLFALYLYFKCNWVKKGKFNPNVSSASDKIIGFLSSCCCSICYIAYHLAVPC